MRSIGGFILIGFLSPEGDFMECSSWEHRDKAIEICRDKYHKEYFVGQDAEDYLLSLGYLVLRAKDAYMSYLNEENGKWIILTDKQISWAIEHANLFNEGQKKDMNEILFDQEDIRKRDCI